MKWINCKSDAEKLDAIKDYCAAQIRENNFSIAAYEADRACSLDYADEIHALKIANSRFEKILEIVNASGYACIMV